MANGFQPNGSVSTVFWRYQVLDALGRVANEQYVNFGLVKWFKTNRAASPVVGGALDQVLLWYNPKEQNDDPDLKLLGPAATALLTALDSIWAGTGPTPGFQPGAAIETAFWRWQYTNAQNMVTNEVYLNAGAIKWMKTLREPMPQVSLWFGNKDQDFNPDLMLKDGTATLFLANLDTIWTI